MRAHLFLPLLLAALALPALSGCDAAGIETADPVFADAKPPILGPSVLCGQAEYSYNGPGTFDIWSFDMGNSQYPGIINLNWGYTTQDDPVVIHAVAEGYIMIYAENTAGLVSSKLVYVDVTC